MADQKISALTEATVAEIQANPLFLAGYLSGGDNRRLGVKYGTFSPELRSGSSGTGRAYSYNLGTYIRIGPLVFVDIAIKLSALGSGTGSTRIYGMPFAPVSLGGTYPGSLSCFVGNFAASTFTVGGPIVTVVNSSYWQIQKPTDTGVTGLVETALTSTSEVFISGVYRTNDAN